MHKTTITYRIKINFVWNKNGLTRKTEQRLIEKLVKTSIICRWSA